jgi:pyruvate dehydrogenase E1 component alpha subunit
MNHAEHDINRSWSDEGKLDLYRQMTRIRRFEQASLKNYNAGKMGGLLPLSIGQETIAAGVRAMMGADDHTISGWRGIGHAIAAGIEMGPCIPSSWANAADAPRAKAARFHFMPRPIITGVAMESPPRTRHSRQGWHSL